MVFEITRYSRYERDEVIRLLEVSEYAHQHLDWRAVEGWLDDPGGAIRVAKDGGRVVGCMAASAPYNGVSWLRLVAVANGQSVALMLDAMWPQVRASLAACNAKQLGALVIHPWLAVYLPGLGFRQVNRVITLGRTGTRLPPPLRADLRVRPVRWDDIEAVAAADNAAFAPLWQYSIRDLQDASRVAARFTLAELNERVVGYQLATEHTRAAHIVRLATMPELQGMGMGGMLLGEVIEFFLKRKIDEITVNTQADNSASLNLYRRFGFSETGQESAVWVAAL
jgi:ribosomal-protein-alanine N-acetyltransferase